MAQARGSNNNPRQVQRSRRAELRKKVLREEETCGICGEWVDVTLPHGLPESPEVDEILPVSLGGDPLDRQNVRLAHRLCNQRRGNKMPFVKPVQGITTSRQW